jgi:hypothetical protein
MIVLDEQLLGSDLPARIKRWYRGTITNILQLRSGSLIPDDAIPALLRSVRQPTFVTINVKDFWRRMAPDARFAITCFAITDREIGQIPSLLRRLFATPPFQTRRDRLGKIARVSRQQVQYYTTHSWAIQSIDWPYQRE